jgi:hypothetical protein
VTPFFPLRENIVPLLTPTKKGRGFGGVLLNALIVVNNFISMRLPFFFQTHPNQKGRGFKRRNFYFIYKPLLTPTKKVGVSSWQVKGTLPLFLKKGILFIGFLPTGPLFSIKWGGTPLRSKKNIPSFFKKGPPLPTGGAPVGCGQFF